MLEAAEIGTCLHAGAGGRACQAGAEHTCQHTGVPSSLAFAEAGPLVEHSSLPGWQCQPGSAAGSVVDTVQDLAAGRRLLGDRPMPGHMDPGVAECRVQTALYGSTNCAKQICLMRSSAEPAQEAFPRAPHKRLIKKL